MKKTSVNKKLSVRKNLVSLIVSYTVLILGGFVMVYPFIYTFLGALLTLDEYLVAGPLPIPGDLNISRFANFLKFFDHEDVWSSIGITLVRFVFYAFTNILFSMIGGYIFAKVNFKGKAVVFYYLMMSMMIPGVATMYPTFLMYAKWPLVGGNNILGIGGRGFIGNWSVMFIGGWFGAYNIFLVRQSIFDVGDAIGESAEIDGASTMKVIFYIYLPLLKAVMAVIIIGLFICFWNDYLFPMTFMDGTSTPGLIPIGYKVFEIISRAEGNSSQLPNYPAIFGVCFTAMLPTILVYAILQKQFVEGMAMGAVKG
ncbi:MAG: carbohydrate ABC transporter permease [Christensenellales bacterium]